MAMLLFRRGGMHQRMRVMDVKRGIGGGIGGGGGSSSSLLSSMVMAGRGEGELGAAAVRAKASRRDEDEDEDQSFIFGGGSAVSARKMEYGVHGWGRKAANIAERVLSEEKLFEGSLQLYAIQVETTSRRVHVVLDALDSETGSPVLDDIVAFAGLYREAWDEAVALQEEHQRQQEDGEEVVENDMSSLMPDDFELTTSSPGAERRVEGMDELRRFRSMPMRVVYTPRGAQEEEQSPSNKSEVLQLLWLPGDDNEPPVSVDQQQLHDDDTDNAKQQQSLWAVANVKVNRAKGKAKPSRANRDRRIWIHADDILRINLHLDV